MSDATQRLMKSLSLIAGGALVAAAALFLEQPSLLNAEARLCSLLPGSTLALIRVEQDIMLPAATTRVEPMMSSGVRSGPGDSRLATPTTPMPAARVRLIQLDSASRAILARRGVTDSQPLAFIRAAPYGADCRTVRWTDTTRFVESGDVGYVRAIIAPREQWIDGLPVLVIAEVWDYPYPRRRGLAYNAMPNEPLASAEAMFGLNSVLNVDRTASSRAAFDSVKRSRALAWARANPVAAELEPARRLLRQAVLESDWEVVSRAPSRLRGSYRVTVDASGKRSTWFFRTYDRPGYGWRNPAAAHMTADLLASPHVDGYRLVGYPAGSPDSLPSASPKLAVRPLVWLTTSDRPTAPGNDARRVLPGLLEFNLSAAPESLWDDLEVFVPRTSVSDSLMRARMNYTITRGQKQPQLPLTIRLDERGGVRADTTLTVGGREIRIVLDRLDTLSIKRPF